MNQINSLLPKSDPIAERRRALGKVYCLLLRLADEAEKSSTAAHSINDQEEKIEQPVVAQEPPSQQRSTL